MNTSQIVLVGALGNHWPLLKAWVALLHVEEPILAVSIRRVWFIEPGITFSFYAVYL